MRNRVLFLSLVAGAATLVNSAATLPPGRFAILSTKASVETGDRCLVDEFRIEGASKKILLRALGPSIPEFGDLADPTLELRSGDGALVASNDNWRSDQEAEIQATGLAPPNDVEAAIVATLNAGFYAAVVRGRDGGTGTAIGEVYDLDASNTSSSLTAFGARGPVENLFAEVSCSFENIQFLVRVLGPSLTSAGFSGAVQDPVLSLYRNGTLVASNDNWRSDQEAEIQASGLAPMDDRESAIVRTASPATYKGVPSAVGTGGIAMVEFYHLPYTGSPLPVILIPPSATPTPTPTPTPVPTPIPTPTPGIVGVFYDTGNLSVGRSGHTATLLPNGKVLVAGGSSSSPSAELYDPAFGTWTSTVGLITVRSLHTATLLPNGKVLVVGGGTTNGSLASAELYDPVLGTWTATGSLETARYSHTATLLPNGKVLVAGGYDGSSFLAAAELYDPASATWSPTSSLATARRNHTATLLPNGKVLVAAGSGSNSSNGTLASAELYDPASGTWALTHSLVTARDLHTATLLFNGNVLVVGGHHESATYASAELYDPVLGTWTATGSLGTARYSHTATLLPNGNVLVAGGRASNVTASAELYNLASGIWMATGSLPRGGTYNHTATLLRSGNVLVVGDGVHASLYIGPPTSPASLNISTRMRVLTDNQVLIGGFIITGTDLKRVLIRGIGPSLIGVGGSLSDPTLELHQGSTTVMTNDNWKTRLDGTSQQADIEATTIPPTNDLEPAILAMLSPGAYTAILAGKNGETGIGLVEIYDLGQGANSKLANISTRGLVDTGDNAMIGGFIVGGGSASATSKIIVRAIGPSLNVPGKLANPTLELHDGNGGLIASNDDWRSDHEAEIIATTIPPTNDLESAIVQNFPPGNYTAVVRGLNGTTGVALVEAYGLN
jgi:hypothetical protein